MSSASSRDVLRHLNTLFHCGVAWQLSDAELLERFVAGRDEDAEAAFAALVDRHGAMVLGVCRRVLGNRDGSEDAFQATFLVLAKKAAVLARRDQLASWLHGVARRAALDARARAIRQKAKENRLVATLPVEPPDQTMASELRTILDEELARLPDRHRTVIVLCELEGLSRRDAAVRLGISEGTLSSRLARAKQRLRDRLTRRGFALSAAILASLLGQDAHAVLVSRALVDSTIRAASLVAAGSSLAGVVSTSVTTITDGVLKAMLLAKLKFVVLGVISLAVVTAGVGVMAQDGPNRSSDNDRLRAVERKLDRLLEVMGGSRRPEAPPESVPPAPPTPAATPLGAAPSAVPTPAAAPTPLGPRSRTLSGLPVPPAVPPPPSPPTVAAGWPAADAPAATAPAGRFSQPRANRGDLAGRIDLLERRLGNLERRFSDLERRINTGHSRQRTTPNPAYFRDAPPGGFDNAPPGPPSNSSPFDADPPNLPGASSPFENESTAAAHLTPPSRSLPSADTVPPSTSGTRATSSSSSPSSDVAPTAPAPGDVPGYGPPSADSAPRLN